MPLHRIFQSSIHLVLGTASFGCFTIVRSFQYGFLLPYLPRLQAIFISLSILGSEVCSWISFSQMLGCRTVEQMPTLAVHRIESDEVMMQNSYSRRTNTLIYQVRRFEHDEYWFSIPGTVTSWTGGQKSRSLSHRLKFFVEKFSTLLEIQWLSGTRWGFFGYACEAFSWYWRPPLISASRLPLKSRKWWITTVSLKYCCTPIGHCTENY